MPREPQQRGRAVEWGIPIAVAILTFVAFIPTLQNGFVTWDDDRNFLDNPYYRGLGLTQLKWMWTTFHMGHYVPLSWMSLGLDYELWGMNAAGYHLTSLLLHAANAAAIYFVARRLIGLAFADSPKRDAKRDTRRDTLAVSLAAAFAALVYSVHPLRVESVAWATERRDVLSGLIYALCVLSYLRACEPGTASPRRWYWLAVAGFVCALLSKATAITLPAVLLILNVYPLKRLGGAAGWRTAAARSVYLELIPFALLAAATVPLTLLALAPPAQLGLGAKLAVSAYSLWFYLWKTIVPTGLSPLYAMPQHVNPGSAMFIWSYAIVAAIGAGAWMARRRYPGVTAVILVFFAIILPMLGIVQNGPQIAADRYTYHAAPALAMLAGALWLALHDHFPALGLRAVGLVILVGLSTLTWSQSKIWHDPRTFWSYVSSRDGESSIAETALGNVLLKEEKPADAVPHFARAVVLDPAYAEGHDNFGIALSKLGRVPEAIEQFRLALSISPRNHESHNNLGVALARQGQPADAIEEFTRALAIKPDYADAQTNWGNTLVRLGRFDEAVEHYQRAVQIRPDNADAHLNWGVALAQQGKMTEAIAHFRQALAINPDHAEARAYLEKALQLAR